MIYCEHTAGPGEAAYASFDLSNTGWNAAVAFFSSVAASAQPTTLVSAAPIVSRDSMTGTITGRPERTSFRPDLNIAPRRVMRFRADDVLVALRLDFDDAPLVSSVENTVSRLERWVTRLLFRDAVPVASLAAGEVQFLSGFNAAT
jgi:hypothetical protein